MQAWSLSLPQDNSEDPFFFQTPHALSQVFHQEYISAKCSSLLSAASFPFLPQLLVPRALPKKNFLQANLCLGVYFPGWSMFNSFPSFHLWYLWGKGLLFANSISTNPEKDSHWLLILSNCVAWTVLWAQGYHIGQHSSGAVTGAWNMTSPPWCRRPPLHLCVQTVTQDSAPHIWISRVPTRRNNSHKWVRGLAQKWHWEDPWEPDTLLPPYTETGIPLFLLTRCNLPSPYSNFESYPM